MPFALPRAITSAADNVAGSERTNADLLTPPPDPLRALAPDGLGCWVLRRAIARIACTSLRVSFIPFALARAITSADGMSNERLRTKADLLGLAAVLFFGCLGICTVLRSKAE